MQIDQTSLALYFFTIFLILIIHIAEKLIPSNRQTRTRTGFDSITGKPYIQTDTPKPPDTINPKLLNNIIKSYSEYGINITPDHIAYLSTLSNPSEVHNFIDTHYITK